MIDIEMWVGEVDARLAAIANSERAPIMAAYMKGHFAFYGVQAGERRAAVRPLTAELRLASADELVAAAEALFDQEHRELHYTACDLLRRWVAHLGTTDLGAICALIETHSWWDTVDAPAAHVVGPIVRADRSNLAPVMDRWIDESLWVARSAILHQLTYKADTDEQQLFRHVVRRAGDKEFFIRKALGWALRQHARVRPDAGRAFVEQHREELSGLTIREATKHL